MNCLSQVRIWTKEMTWFKTAWYCIDILAESDIICWMKNIISGKVDFFLNIFPPTQNCYLKSIKSWITQMDKHYICEDYMFIYASDRELKYRFKKKKLKSLYAKSQWSVRHHWWWKNHTNMPTWVQCPEPKRKKRIYCMCCLLIYTGTW